MLAQIRRNHDKDSAIRGEATKATDKGGTVVIGRRTGVLGADLNIRQHSVRSGLLAALGGVDDGPNPHELLEAALAACTILTMQMYAIRKGWPLASANVRVSITAEGDETAMKREIEMQGNLSAEQRTRLLEIANKCPIHKILSGPVTITTEEAHGLGKP